MNGLFKLYSNDYIKGLITAVFAAVIVALYNIVIVSGFSFFKVNYHDLFQNMVDTGGITLIAYLAKNFLSTNKGSLLNVTPNDSN